MKAAPMLFALAAALLASCSGDGRFSDDDKLEIFVDGILPEFYMDTLYLDSYISIDSKSGSRQASLAEMSRYLRSYFWLIDGDTSISARPRRKVSYGWHLAELVLVSFCGDTLRHSEYIFHKEPLRAALLSPVDNYRVFPDSPLVWFDYKLSGTDKDSAEHSVYILAEGDSLWEELDSDSIWLSGSISWKIMAHFEQDTAFSEARRIWLEK